MRAMFILTGERDDDFPVEIEILGEEAIALARQLACVPNGNLPSFTNYSLQDEDAFRLGSISSNNTKGAPFYSDGKFTPPNVKSWSLVVQRLYKF